MVAEVTFTSQFYSYNFATFLVYFDWERVQISAHTVQFIYTPSPLINIIVSFIANTNMLLRVVFLFFFVVGWFRLNFTSVSTAAEPSRSHYISVCLRVINKQMAADIVSRFH